MPLIDDIALDSSLPVPERAQRVTLALASQPDRGLAEAVACLLRTDDERVAQYAVDHLALLPDGGAEKTRAAERLRGSRECVGAASRLVPWLPDTLLDAFVEDYVAAPDPRSPLFSVIFEIAMYRPELLRPHRARLEPPALQEGMLSGAPDAWVDELVERWEDDRDDRVLDEIARVRTPRAAEVLRGLRDEIGDDERWSILLGMAGQLPEGGPAARLPAHMGFVVDRGESSLPMGGPFTGMVPACVICSQPSEPVLTVPASAGLARDATFFWFGCGCNAVDFTSVQLRPDAPEGNKVFYGPAVPAGPERRIVPGGERALRLRPHPNPHGVSIDATGSFGMHQVGGLPDWIRPALHSRCPLCSRTMPFVAQIDSGMSLFGRLGFTGMLFCFWCDECAVSETVRQA